jgi:hypothetical protein
MRYRVIDPLELCSSKRLHQNGVHITDFLDSSNFREFLESYQASLIMLMEKYSIPYHTQKILIQQYSKPSLFIQTIGMGTQLTYHWPHSEFKSIIFNDGLLVTQDRYWLPFYPFVAFNESELGGNLSVRINPSFKDSAKISDISPSPLYCVSHNNHFGHFVFDDLPRLYLDLVLFKTHIEEAYIASELSTGIHDLLGLITIKKKWHFEGTTSQNSLVSSSRCLASYITNKVVNIYILRRILSQKQAGLKISSRSVKIFLRRGNLNYNSRIANIKQIKEYLEENGVIVLDPSEIKPLDMIKKMSEATLVFAESGTTSLIASMFTQSKCRVVTFVPDILLYETSHAMLLSGLPYHLFDPRKQDFIIGTPIVKHNIQSSSICSYRVSDCAKFLDNLDG